MSRNTTKRASRGFKNLLQSDLGYDVFPRATLGELQHEDKLPYVTLQGDDTVLTRGNELFQCIRVGGLNAMTASDEQIDQLKESIAHIMSQAGLRYSFYIHKISRPLPLDMAEMPAGGLAAAVDERWRSHLTRRGMRDRTLTVTVMNRPSTILKTLSALERVRGFFGGRDPAADFFEARDKRIADLSETVSVVLAACSGMGGRVLTATSGELLGFLEGIGCGIETPTFQNNERGVLARSTANFRTTFVGNRITISGGTIPNRIGRIFTIKSYPNFAYAGMFDALNLPLDMVVTHSFVPVHDDLVAEKIRRDRHQRTSLSNAALSETARLEAAADDLASGRIVFGEHMMTVAVYTDNDETLALATSEIRNIAKDVGVKMINEAFASPAHYFAQHPGNMTFRARRSLISNRVFAGMASLHRSPLGKPSQELFWQSPITTFPTLDGSAYKFSFHKAGSPHDEPPEGHTLILGPTGGGKSLLTSFLMASAQRMGARVFAFDYKRGLQNQILALGGNYASISPKAPTGLNPLYGETDPDGVSWLSDWLVALLARPDKPWTPEQRNQVHEKVVENAAAPDELRNFDAFRQLFAHIDDDGDLQERVREWTTDGRYGWAFGQNRRDTFSLDGNLFGFDLTDLMDTGSVKEREAILGYLFRRVERALSSREPTIVIIEEAWKAFDNNYFSDRIHNWLYSARKQNAVVLLITQFATQIEASKSGKSLMQAINTKLLLPNPAASRDNFSLLNLNDKELDVLLGTPKGTHIALIQSDDGSVVVDCNMKPLGPFFPVLEGGEAALRALGPDFPSNPEAWRKYL